MTVFPKIEIPCEMARNLELGSSANESKQQVAEFCSRWDIAELFVFGSVLRDDFHPDSDIDFLYERDPNTKYSFSTLFDMEDELEKIFGRKAHLVSREPIEDGQNHIRKKLIFESMQVIYDAGNGESVRSARLLAAAIPWGPTIPDLPRVRLFKKPTPLEHAERLSKELDMELWIKRDDLAGAPLGGNKSRQLEYYLGQAVDQQADTILITGAVQSNFVRIATASAARLGMRTVVQLEDRVPLDSEDYLHSGNVLLSEVLGAEVMRYPEGEDEEGADRALRERAESLCAEGRRPYVIPLGLGNPPYGAVGSMQLAVEIQNERVAVPFDVAVVASGSGLTHAGLLAGLRRVGERTRVVGGCVRREASLQRARLRRVIDDLEGLVGEPLNIRDRDIEVHDGALAPGYGRIGPAAARAMRLAAQSEGLLLDPVYTAKAFATLLALREEGEIASGSKVVFVHTGGLAAVFAYGAEIRQAMASLDAGA